jgi:phage tail sheath protein FI
MASNVKLGSAGVTVREIDLSGPTTTTPSGVPAGIIGTAVKGPAFVPVTVGNTSDFEAKFGKSDGTKFGVLAVYEWLRNAQSVTYMRVLGVGSGLKRDTSTKPGRVVSAGFVVGEQQPHADSGILTSNSYANSGGVLGRTYMLGCFMSESAGSSIFSSASLQGPNSVTPGNSTALPIVRGILMAPSGVILRLSSSFTSSLAPSSTHIANSNSAASGSILGSVDLGSGKQEFVLMMNGHKGTDAAYPNVLTASFDPTSPNYFANVFNQDPYNLQKAGHYLYAFWDIHPTLAVVTGTGLISSSYAASTATGNKESAAFLLTGSLARDTGNATVPDYENFENRFSHAKSPWVISQKFGGVNKNMFRFVALDAGTSIADKIKISIENISPSSDTKDLYGTFDVAIRDWNDTDSNPRVLEQYRGVSMNPSSDRYIGKAIGDLNVYYDFDKTTTSQKLVVDGNYQNVSNYIRVELDDLVISGELDATALPIGFRGPAHLVTSGSAPLATPTGVDGILDLLTLDALKRPVQPPVPYRVNILEGEGAKALVNSSLYWGLQLEQVNSLTNPNGTSVKNDSLTSYTKYFPDFMTTYQNFVEAGSIGAADTAANGILDVDRFCRNKFSLENIRVVTASNTYADPQKWNNASYVRHGSITSNETDKTRAVTISDFTQPNRKFLKFTMLMQGGFDGVNSFDRNEATLSNTAVNHDMDDANRGQSSGPTAAAYRKAIDIIKEKTDVDIQLLAIPGIRHAIVTDKAIDAVETRFDAMYLMDIQEYDTNNTLITGSVQNSSVVNTTTAFRSRALNTSFAAAYYPDTVVTDPNTNTNVQVPPSVVVLGAFAKNDAVSYPWFAPAGFTRGALETTLEAKVKLSKDNMDTLYDANINPLVAFPGNTPAGTQAQGGVVVWGQRTLQSFASALDRVNVRRLLIDLRRQVRDIANTFVFEPNRESTLNRFQATVEPRLARIQKQFGVERYKVQIDTSTTTQADVENNTLRGKIWIQPTRAIEFVSLDFVVTNAGAQI